MHNTNLDEMVQLKGPKIRLDTNFTCEFPEASEISKEFKKIFSIIMKYYKEAV